ncbi:MAG: hypothetical protein ACJ8DZ_13585 [Allosphingosinicella sp.]
MKVAICIPCYGDVKSGFAISLARLLVATLTASVGSPAGRVTFEIEIFSAVSSDLVANRTLLLRRAMEWDARYLLWLDSDHVFPPDALLRLLSHALPVVGCNYPRRAAPTGPVATRYNQAGELEQLWTTAAKAQAGEIEEVAVLGLGFCLLDMRIFAQVQAHAEAGAGWAKWEPFERILSPDTGSRMGEDAAFFAALRAAGVKAYVDHGLSWHIGHVAERILTNADAEAERDAWIARHG